MSERARFTPTGRWLVCSGAPQFLDVASKAVGAGFQGGIEWLPEVDDAVRRVREHYRRAAGCIVAQGCLGADPRMAAARIAGIRGGVMVILVEDGTDLGEDDPLLDDVDVVIPPGMLLSALVGLAEHARAAKRRADAAEPRRPAEDPLAPAPVPHAADVYPPPPTGARTEQPVPTMGSFVAGWPVRDLLDRPPSRGSMPPPTGPGPLPEPPYPAVSRPPAPTPAIDAAHLVPAGMRATGSIPRVNRASASPGPGSPPAHASRPTPGQAHADARTTDVSSSPSERAPTAAVSPDAGAPTAAAPAKEPPIRLLAAREDVPRIQVAGFPPDQGEGGATPTICVASARGGVGKSTVAALMAVSLAQSGLSVALIDVDFQFGTCLGFLGADETDGLTEAVGMGESVVLDDRALARCRATPVHGVSAYEFCRLPERAELLVPHVGALVRAARAGADIAVVDLPVGMSEGVAQALEVADRCVLVGDHRALSLESMGALASLCGRAGIPGTKLVSLVNRCDPRHRDETFLTRARFELKTPQVLHVLDGGPDVDALLSCGSASELLESRNRAALSAADVASKLAGELGRAARPVQAAPARPAVLLGRAGRFRRGRAGGRAGAAPCPS